MSFRKFFLLTIFTVSSLLLGAVAINVFVNEFGVYGDIRGRELRVWAYERATKYLYSTNYIPSNFDSVMLGPSVSDVMLDTRKISAVRMYNMSLNGANICELKALYDNVSKRRRLDSVVLFLSPFLLQDCEMKTTEINPRVEQSALGSIFTIRYYFMKFNAMLNPDDDPFRESWWGFRFNTPLPPGYDNSNAIKQIVDNGFELNTEISPGAAEALREITSTASEQGARIIVAYPPMPHALYEVVARELTQFRLQVEKLLPPGCIVVDFNGGDYFGLTNNAANFHDPTHLNEKGAAIVLEKLNELLE